MVDQGILRFRLPGVQCLLQGIEHEIGVHGTADPPTNDAPGEHVDDEGHVQPALPGRDVGEIGNPKLIGSVGLELSIDAIKRTRRSRIACGRAHHLAADDTAQPSAAHEPLDGATGHRNAITVQLLPDLVGAIDLHVGLPDALDMRDQNIVTPGSGTAQGGIAPLRRVTPIARRGDPQHLADRLDPEAVAVLVDEGSHHFNRRSSSA
ncbi:hypothetical protein D3C86_1168920 [compost metagenome]